MVPRSGASNSYLKDKLYSMSIILDEFYIYYPQGETLNQELIEFSKQLEMNKVHVLIFTSPSAVRYLFSILQEILPDFKRHVKNIQAVISIGPNTTRELKSIDIFPIESKEHTIKGTVRLADTILSEV
jgi:uroporphyrinogen-III synthase